MAFEEKGEKDRRVRYEVRPRKPLPLDAELELTIDERLRGRRVR